MGTKKEKKEKTNLYAFIQPQAEAALRMAKTARFDEGGIANMLGAFACELFLKIILDSDESDMTEGHDLKVLFGKVCEKFPIAKEQILSIYEERKGPNYLILRSNITMVCSRIPEWITARQEFEIKLDRDRLVFINLRYFYEKPGILRFDDFVIEFAEVLKEFIYSNPNEYKLLW